MSVYKNSHNPLKRHKFGLNRLDRRMLVSLRNGNVRVSSYVHDLARGEHLSKIG